MIHGSDRFSEDLDFDNFGLAKDEFVALTELARAQLGKEGFSVEINHVLRQSFRAYLKFAGLLYQYGISGHRREKLTIQLDTTSQDFPVKTDHQIVNKFGVFSRVRMNPVDVLLAQKFAAIIGRKRIMGRDLYDVVYLSSLASPHLGYLRAKTGLRSAGELVEKLNKRLAGYNLVDLAQDISPFVSSERRLEVVRKFDVWLAGWGEREKLRART